MDTLCHKAYGKGHRYPFKLCRGCCSASGPGPTTEYTAAEMDIIKRAIDIYKNELYKKYGIRANHAHVLASHAHVLANHAYG